MICSALKRHVLTILKRTCGTNLDGDHAIHAKRGMRRSGQAHHLRSFSNGPDPQAKYEFLHWLCVPSPQWLDEWRIPEGPVLLAAGFLMMRFRSLLHARNSTQQFDKSDQ